MVLYEALLRLRNMSDMDFASTILDHCKVFTDTNCPLSYVTWDKKTRRYVISVCQESIDKGVDYTMRDIVHEVLHIGYDHFDEKYREGKKELLNVAMDCIINSNSFLAKDPEWVKDLPTFESVTKGQMNPKDHTSQDIYNWLLKNAPPKPSGGGSELPQSRDDHSKMESQPDDGSGVESQDERPTNLVELLGEEKAKDVAQGIGTKEVMDKIQHLIAANKQLNLKREISLCLKRGNISKINIKKPTRRPLTAPFGRRKIKNKLTLVIDTSGSIYHDPEMLELVSHTFAECKKIGDVEVFMGDCSLSAHHKDAKTLPQLKGGGGSNFGWLKDIKSDQLIFITDGYITDDSDCDYCSLVVVKGNNNLQTKARQVIVK